MEPVLQGFQVFWCFDFFSEYLQKSLYISIFLYFVWNRLPRFWLADTKFGQTFLGGKPPLASARGLAEGPFSDRPKTTKFEFRQNIEIWRYGAGFAGFPGFLVFWFFFRIPPKVTLYLHIPIFCLKSTSSLLIGWHEIRTNVFGGQASASLRSGACGGSIFRPTKNH